MLLFWISLQKYLYQAMHSSFNYNDFIAENVDEENGDCSCKIQFALTNQTYSTEN